jgi:hypothetical protein
MIQDQLDMIKSFLHFNTALFLSYTVSTLSILLLLAYLELHIRTFDILLIDVKNKKAWLLLTYI